MPIFMAAMGDQALSLCGQLADGLMVSNLSPPAFTRRALAIATRAAVAAGRPTPAEVIQYVSCAIGDDGAEARQRAKITVGRMLTSYVHDGHASTATQSALRDYNGMDPDEFKRTMKRLASGEPAPDVIGDGLLRQYAIAGTPDECLEQCAVYADAGVTELGIWFAEPQASAEIANFGRALATIGR